MSKELTFEEFCSMPLTYCLGMTYDWGARRMHRNEDLKLQKETITMRKKKDCIYSGWKTPDISYFLDGDAREFKTPDQVYVAYMERVCNVG
jgi:hypothetical protein